MFYFITKKKRKKEKKKELGKDKFRWEMYIYELRKLVKLVDEFITFCFYNVSELLFYQIWGLQILVKLVVNNNILSTMDV